MVTITMVPAVIQGQGKLNNIPSTLPGLTKVQQIGQLDKIFTVSSFLNLNGRTWDDMTNKGKNKGTKYLLSIHQ